MTAVLTKIDAEKTAKFSFSDHLAKQQAAKHNSDLSNLASAFEAVESAIVELERLRRNIESMAKRIEEGEVLPVEEVRKVYNQAMTSGRPL